MDSGSAGMRDLSEKTRIDITSHRRPAFRPTNLFSVLRRMSADTIRSAQLRSNRTLAVFHEITMINAASFRRMARTTTAIVIVSLVIASRLNAQAPTISSISPNTVTAGSPGLTLNVTGTNFNPASQLQWNGSARPTSPISANQLTANISASDLASPGVAQVTVFNPTSGLTSNPQAFTILAVGPPPSSAPPTLISVGPAIAAQGSRHLQLTLRGTNFRPGASVVISPPLASILLSQANQPASDIVVENLSLLNSSLITVVISTSSSAITGLRAVDVVNADSTNTGSQPTIGSGTSKPLTLALANSLGAPLGIRTIAITQPRDGLVISQGDEFFAEAVLAGAGTGTVTGEWVWDGAVSEQFATAMTGGERALLKTPRGLPTFSLGLHTLELRITSPNLLASRPIQIVINPGTWQSMRLLRPAPGTVITNGKPPLLKWLPVAGASYYQVGFAARPFFASITRWHDVTDSEWQIPHQVWFDLPEGELYWTVRVIEASGAIRKPLPMRRLIKAPSQAYIARPEIRGGPVDPGVQVQEPPPSQEAAQSGESQKPSVSANEANSDAEPEKAPSASPPSEQITAAAQPVFSSHQTQISMNTQWVSGSAADSSVIALAQQSSYQNGPWSAEINGSGLLNSLLGPEPRHALGRANDYLFRMAFDRPHWGINLRFGVLAPALYTGSEFITTAVARQGIEPSLRTRAGTFGFWANTNDIAPGAGLSTNFHQQLIGGSYEAPLPQSRALLRAMWLSSRDVGQPALTAFTGNGAAVTTADSLAIHSRADSYGGLFQLYLGPQWLWTSEYAWSYSNVGLGIASSPLQFGRAWRTGITGSRWQTQFSFNYRDTGPNFSNPANPGLTRLAVPGRRGMDGTASRVFRIGTFSAGYQFLQSDIGDRQRPAISLHNLTGAWSRNLTPTTVASLQVHEAHTTSGESPPTAAQDTPPTDTRDRGANVTVTRTFHNFTLGALASRDWFRNRIFNTANVNTANVITSSAGLSANLNARTWFQVNSNFSVNWIAADKNTVGDTRIISIFIQPMLTWKQTGLTVSPLITVGQTETQLASGILLADTLNSQYGGRLSWQWPGPLKFSTLSFEGGHVKLRNAVSGLEQNDTRALLLWSLVWGHGPGLPPH